MLDVSKAKKVLGFEAKTTMAEGIKRTMGWYRNSQNQKA
jgi:nucleoside-diphosphate-sugar epimerase